MSRKSYTLVALVVAVSLFSSTFGVASVFAADTNPTAGFAVNSVWERTQPDPKDLSLHIDALVSVKEMGFT